MKQLFLLITNSVSLLFTLIINYRIGTGDSSNATVGEISARYENLFTPAGYAFIIWGVIYVLLLLFVGYQWYAWLKSKNDDYLKRTGLWFLLSNLANGFWILAWTNDRIGLSLLLILVLLVSLVMLMFRLQLETVDAPLRTIAFVWWPVAVYLGWIVVASLANLAAYSVFLDPTYAFAREKAWGVVLIALALLVYLSLIYFRNMREAAFTGIWALMAIAVKQWQEAQIVAFTALTASAVLLVYSLWQAFRNRATMPWNKIKRGEI